MPRLAALLVIGLALALTLGCVEMTSETSIDEESDALISEHMVAEALLTAHYIDAALKAGMTREEINAVLSKVADETVITEFWVSGPDGRVEFTNVTGIDFTFPTDPDAGTQAAPFADLLNGRETVVIQGAQAREADEALFKYVGVAGVDMPRIVQVGIEGSAQ